MSTRRWLSLAISIAALALSLAAACLSAQGLHAHRESIKARMHWTNAQLDSALRSIR